MIVGIDASNIRAGGGVTHLVELLRAADPYEHGFSQVIVWSGQDTLRRIEDRPWLVKSHHWLLDRSLPFRTFWQAFSLTPAAMTAGCDVLFVPGGSYVGGFRPMVAFHQNLLPFQWTELRRFGWSWTTFKLLLLRLTQGRTFRKADGVIFLTNQARDAVTRVIGHINGISNVIPHGIDPRFLRRPREQRPISEYSPDRPLKLLYVSIINVYKHQWHVADAVAQLRRDGLPITLDLVGPAYAPALSRLNRTLDRIDPRREFVRCVGEISYSRLHAVYAEADLCVFASTCETFGQILTEAMSAGLPIASSTQAAMQELLGDAGVYFSPERPDEIALALRTLIDSPELRSAKASAAFRRATELPWDQCARSTFAHFADVIRRAGIERLESWRLQETEARIAVEGWSVRQPIGDQFMERPLSPRLVWNYLRHVGPVAVWRKIRSRLAERVRNRKIAGLGTGRVLAAPESSGLTAGQRVIFFAPNHSPDWPNLCLDTRLLEPIPETRTAAELPRPDALPESLRPYIGWSAFSGTPLHAEELRRELKRLAATGVASEPKAVRFSRAPLQIPKHAPEASQTSKARSAVVFGLGSYAKTQIIPHVRRHLRLATIHEIDPDQLATAQHLGARLDTRPEPHEWERYDAWFVAGFHHTHGSIAIRALQAGAYAVVEKPLVTTSRDYETIERLVAGSRESRLFTCFQKRYSRVNEWAWRDMGVAPGDPIDMHCLVYEIPLPPLHWYNWPNSGSRLVSNGCHWLDYFMFMNEFSPVTDAYARPLRGSDLSVAVSLANGAQLTMTVTDTGSERLGVREVMDLRSGNTTVRIVDASEYTSENTHHVIRRRHVNPMGSYKRMYDAICRRIVARQPGDSLASLRSTALMLELEGHLPHRERAIL